jgi:hypothetical protein
LAGGEIDRAHAVIAQLGDEEALPPQIDREVIDAAAHLTKQDFGFERERRFRGLSFTGETQAYSRCH